MSTITKYLTIGLGAIAVILLLYCSQLRNKRDEALAKLDNLNQQLNTAVSANLSLQKTLTALKIEVAKNIIYIKGLEENKRRTESDYQRQIEDFRHVKNSNKTIDDWANSKLPVGLFK